jgi:transposase-like protein
MPKRRQFTPEFKARVVLEVISGAKSGAEVSREHNLKPDLLSRWKAEFLANAAKVFERSETADPQQARIAELERLAGKLSLDLEIAKKASTLLGSTGNRNGS